VATATIDRRCHWLRKNKSSTRPEVILFVDTESTERALGEKVAEHSLKVGWSCLTQYVPGDGLEVLGWYKITDDISFWHLVSQVAVEHKRTYIVSHNIDYDARVLRAFSILPGIGWTPAYAILGESCRFFTFRSGKNTIALLDNLNYWRVPLSVLGHEFGIEKMHVNFDTVSDDDLSRYCKNDVKILVKVWDYWLGFLDRHDLGNFSITISGQAFRAFRHRFMEHKIGIHNRADAIKLERMSYKGGRCEVWRTGHFTGETFYKLDVNGLYAYVMQQFPVPRALVKVLVNVSPAYLEKLLEKYLVVADCIVETDEPIYALHSRGFNIFPAGTFRATLTTPEIRYALERGHLRAIGEVAIYQGDVLFKKFIDYFTPLRQQYKATGDTARSAMCKMIRNSLYGKFGQRGYTQKKIGVAPLGKVSVRHWLDLESQRECWDWTYGGVVIRQEKGGEAEDSFPGIASHIAAYGRLVLWDYAAGAGLENVYYADTDSLIVNQTGYDNLAEWIDPLRLGFLKLEGETADLEILAKKSYAFGEKRTAKGIRKNAVQQMDGSWRQVHFTSLKWAFRHGNLDNVTVFEVDRHMQNTVTHGKIDDDGRVHPPQFGLKQEEVAALIAPVDVYSWNWWVDVPWLQSLRTEKRLDLRSMFPYLFESSHAIEPLGF